MSAAAAATVAVVVGVYLVTRKSPYPSTPESKRDFMSPEWMPPKNPETNP